MAVFVAFVICNQFCAVENLLFLTKRRGGGPPRADDGLFTRPVRGSIQNYVDLILRGHVMQQQFPRRVAVHILMTVRGCIAIHARKYVYDRLKKKNKAARCGGIFHAHIVLLRAALLFGVTQECRFKCFI